LVYFFLYWLKFFSLGAHWKGSGAEGLLVVVGGVVVLLRLEVLSGHALHLRIVVGGLLESLLLHPLLLLVERHLAVWRVRLRVLLLVLGGSLQELVFKGTGRYRNL
jgi:hypothetical protein